MNCGLIKQLQQAEQNSEFKILSEQEKERRPLVRVSSVSVVVKLAPIIFEQVAQKNCTRPKSKRQHVQDHWLRASGSKQGDSLKMGRREIWKSRK